MKILYITFGLPAPPDSGARVRDCNLIQRVAQHHDVYLLSLLEPGQELEQARGWLDNCKEVDGVTGDRSLMASAMLAFKTLFSKRPLATTPYYFPELDAKISSLSQSIRFDLVQIEHSFLVPYLDALDPGSAHARIISLHNIGVFQYASMMRSSKGREWPMAALKWWLMRHWETAAIDRFDQALVVSEEDLEHLRAIGCRVPAAVIANGVDTLTHPQLPTPKSEELIFVGTMGYLPNREAVRWFVRDVFPRIIESRPDCRLNVVGSGGKEHLGDLQQDGVIEITGTVDKLEAWYQRSKVAVVPLLSGGGTRLKILEAMALGRPVVSTRIGCEGIAVSDGEDILLSDSPEAFADQVIGLLEDEHRWQQIADRARQTVVSAYDWNLLSSQLLQEYEQLMRRTIE